MEIIKIRRRNLHGIVNFLACVTTFLGVVFGGTLQAQQTTATNVSFNSSTNSRQPLLRENPDSAGNYLESRVMEMEQQIKTLQISAAAYENQNQSQSKFYST